MRQLAVVQRLIGVVAACALVLGCAEASATGFFVNQQSVQGRGRVDAGNSAAADELGTIFFNPAGLTEMFREGSGDLRYSFGVQLIIPRSTQANAGTLATTPFLTASVDGQRSHDPTDPSPIPNVYVAKKLSDRAAIGAGINFPFGLAIKSPADWFGRYDAIEASLTTINLSVVGAYRFDGGIAIGGGIDAQYASTKLVTAIPAPFAPDGPSAATDARVETRGHAWTPGYNVGLHYVTPDKDLKLGVHYRSAMTHEIKGSATFSGLLPPLDAINGTYGARADLDLPAVATAGIWKRVGEGVTMMAELEWYQWSRFHDIRTRFDGLPDAVRLENYRDTYAVAVGGDYAMNNSAWTLRGGLKYDRTPTRDGFRDTTVPDSNRLWLGLGASWHRSPTSHIDFAFNHVFFRDTTVDTTRSFFDGTPAATRVRTRADVNAVVNTIAVDARYSF
jgi:long-chain fatty acid transport protein